MWKGNLQRRFHWKLNLWRHEYKYVTRKWAVQRHTRIYLFSLCYDIYHCLSRQNYLFRYEILVLNKTCFGQALCTSVFKILKLPMNIYIVLPKSALLLSMWQKIWCHPSERDNTNLDHRVKKTNFMQNFQSNQDNRQSSNKNNKYQLLYRYGSTSLWRA
jgi:hypothetical protein